MPAPTLLGVAGHVQNGLSVVAGSVPVSVGQLIVVGYFSQVNETYTVTDNLGHVDADYLVVSDFLPPTFGNARMRYCISQFTGSLTITVAHTFSAFAGAIVATYDTSAPLDQVGIQTGKYAPTSGRDLGLGTNPFTYSATLVVTCGFLQRSTASSAVSMTGDTKQFELQGSDEVDIYLFDRYEEGPGNGRTLIEYNTTNLNGGAIAVGTFSLALPKPSPDVNQFAVRGGAGFDNNPGATTIAAQVNRPIEAGLPYTVDIGDTVFVWVAWPGPAATGLSVSDDYGGNNYIQRGFSPAVVGKSNTNVGVFSTTVQYIPAPGLPFRVKANAALPASGAVYQPTAIALSGHPFIPTAYAEYHFNRFENNNPAIDIYTDQAVSVPVNTYLLCFAFYGGTVNQDSIAWTNAEGFTNQQKWEAIQTPSQLTNRPRFGTSVIMDQTVTVSGDFSGHAHGTITGTFGIGGGILMLAVTRPISLRLIKSVSGGTAVITDWTLSAVGPDTISGAGGVGPSVVSAGTYALSESSGPANYVPGAWSCVGGIQSGSSLLLTAGDTAVCTITNTFVGPNPSPEFCIITPITTPTPSFVVYPEPEELKGS